MRRGGNRPTPRNLGRRVALGDLDIRLAAGARPILERELSPTEQAAFLTYMELLLTWQRTYRLVGSSDRRWIIDELILDSLLFVRFLPARAGRKRTNKSESRISSSMIHRRSEEPTSR